MSSIRRSWDVATISSFKTITINGLIAPGPVLPGGPAQTKQEEDWTEALENEETLQVTVRPKQSFSVWQYLLSLGQEPVLLCHDPT
ncbi:hypothetical protein KIL84_010109 [Mauremys mutica]|uniref:Uncharacterized protein n=1 Tax=Mauremys mutica TaxID=74926 RepID=A0A9D4B6M8_9SAUR|nr:hypothetical protein KIL84_010109 [Mauremys mutica]